MTVVYDYETTRPVPDKQSKLMQLQLYHMALGKAMQIPRPSLSPTGRLAGKQPNFWVMDEFTKYSDRDAFHEHISPALHDLGLLNKNAFLKMSTRERNRFVTHALKRARSNHPHNIKWKPLLGIQTAFLVAQKLEL